MTTTDPALIQGCARRKLRLLELMQSERLDWIVLSRHETVQWLVGYRFPVHLFPAAALSASGEVVLIAPHREPEYGCADRVVTYPAKWLSTMRSDQPRAAFDAMLDAVPRLLSARRVGVEFGGRALHLTGRVPAQVIDVEPAMYELRRTKEADELAAIQIAIGGTEAMYATARRLLEPGLSELRMYDALQEAAVEAFGEPLTGTGNDYRCNGRGGGPRRDARAAAGELYILDLGPAYRGYYADNARTLAVTDADDDQRAAWQAILPVFRHIEATVRPGKSCRELFQEVQTMLDAAPVGRFDHHLGHGIGLEPHEGPHLNPNWDDTFREGDVFTAEPGLYDAVRLRHGIRLENDYVVTSDGVRCLTPFSLEL